MLGPAYTIPTTKRMANTELGKYVRAEFRDHDCHWFTCGSIAKQASREPSPPRRSWLSSLLGANRKSARDVSPAVVPCAVLVPNLCEDCNDRGSANK